EPGSHEHSTALFARHHRRRLLHRADDLVVARAAAEVARQPEADAVLVRARLRIEQRLRRDDEARRADAALERCLFQERLLEGMKPVGIPNALDRQDLGALRLDAEDAAGV